MKKLYRGLQYSWSVVWHANRWLMPAYLLLDIVSGLIPLAEVFLLNLLIDFALGAGIEAIVRTAVAWMSVTMLGIVSGLAKGHMKGRMNAMSAQYLDEQLMRKMAAMSLGVLDTSSGRDLCEYAGCCGQTIWDDLFYGTFTVARSAYTFCISAAVLLHFQPLLTVLYLLLTLPGIAMDYAFWDKREKFRRENAADMRKMSYYRWMLVDSWPAKDVRMYDLTEDIRGRYEEEREKYDNGKKALDRTDRNGALLCGLIRRSGEALMLGGILYYAVTGDISVGNVELYAGYALIAAEAFCSGMTTFLGYLKFSCEKVMPEFFEFLGMECPEERTGTRKAEDFKSLEFDRVWFRYPSGEEYVLKEASFTLKKGERLSLVGVNGAGKSTIVKLVLGFYEPDKGRILLNGHPIQEFGARDVRRLFGVLFQDFVQYPLTLRENVAFSDLVRLKDDGAIEASLRRSGGWEDISRKVGNGLDSYMTRRFDDGGTELSKGQWQKVALARVYFKDAPVAILDEPSSALDAQAEDQIFRGMELLSADKTSILISHRISSARASSRIIVLDDGRVAESGTHEELMAKGGLYAKLYSLQKDKYAVDSSEEE